MEAGMYSESVYQTIQGDNEKTLYFVKKNLVLEVHYNRECFLNSVKDVIWKTLNF